MKIHKHICVLLLAVGSLAAQAPPAVVLPTSFTVLVGFPQQEQSSSSAIALVPGTIIPLEEGALPAPGSDRRLVEKSLTYSQAVEKLWQTFRLDPATRMERLTYARAETGRTVPVPGPESAMLSLTATLLGQEGGVATYRVVIKKGQELLADTVSQVRQGGRAVIGAMNGPAAPYIFLFVEPEAAAVAGLSPKDGQPDGKSDGQTMPELIKRQPPAYPEEMKQQGIMGTVVLEITIDEKGQVIDARVLESPHEQLSAAALQAIRQWVFKPATLAGGKPVKVRSMITINFKLK